MDADVPQGPRFDTLPDALRLLEENPEKCVKYTFAAMDIVVILKHSHEDKFFMLVGTTTTEPGEWEEMTVSRRDAMVRIYLTQAVEDRAVEALAGGLADQVDEYLKTAAGE